MSARLDRIMAYVDGELGADQREAFEAEMAADPALAAEVAAHRNLSGRLADAYDPVASEPVPLRLALAAQAANDLPPRRPNLAWAGMAACLVAGILAGRFVLAPETGISVGSQLATRSELARALEDQLASQSGTIRIGLTLRGRDGRYCRTFQSRPDQLAGLACRNGDGWQVRTATRWMQDRTADYRPAASDTPPEVLAAVDQALSGDVLDSAQERAARDGGWR